MTTAESRLSNIRFKLPDAHAQRGEPRSSMQKPVRHTGLWMSAGVGALAITLWSLHLATTGDRPSMAAVAVQPIAPIAAAAPAAAAGTMGLTDRPAAVANAPPDATAAIAAAPALQIWLRGVLATGPKGRAIVAGADGREYVVSVGSRVGTDASVQAIHGDHLLVLQGAKSLVVRLQGAKAPVSEAVNRAVTPAGVSIDVDRLAAEGVDSLSAAEKSAAIGANLVIDDSAEAQMVDTTSTASPGSAAAHGEAGQRFVKNKAR